MIGRQTNPLSIDEWTHTSLISNTQIYLLMARSSNYLYFPSIIDKWIRIKIITLRYKNYSHKKCLVDPTENSLEMKDYPASVDLRSTRHGRVFCVILCASLGGFAIHKEL